MEVGMDEKRRERWQHSYASALPPAGAGCVMAAGRKRVAHDGWPRRVLALPVC